MSGSCENWVAQAVSVQGSVVAKKTGESQWQQVHLHDTFCANDSIETGENSRASFLLTNDSTLRINQNSAFIFQQPNEEKSFFLDLLRGAAHFFSRTPRALEVRTPHTSAGVRGTEFLVSIEDDRTLLIVYEGAVLAENSAGSLTLESGQAAIVETGKAPLLSVVAKPRDAVNWALYYPPVLQQPGQGTIENGDDHQFLLQRASQLLRVGRVDRANDDISSVLRLDPGNPDALALQTIITIVGNDNKKALEIAQKAVDASPASATALIALSYARQAVFDLEGARESLEAAVKADPQNSLAWARLAEVWSSLGLLDKSLDAAQQAVAIAPNLSRTQTVLGFAYLTQVETGEARSAFEKAIELDQADPLPRLGLGLAIIRDGDLQAGGRQIEIAASLAPNNSLIRSYLGKTYYEQKRTKLDGREYGIAKELDPNDPTPWFYDAIRKQTINRPVEALHDMQRAIELNGNQAVYRSSLLLDSDLASRSSSLARIYNDLGFQQRGLVEGWNSVNTDPANFSAHRFLADSYSALPRHEIARVSELLQAQLLQPINITPIQPQLAESNLSLISRQGPSSAGFSSYNPLFNRNGGTVQVGLLGGENSTWGAEGIASAIYDKLSISAGYSGSDTDGYRDNNDQDIDIANFFAQYQLTYKTSIQAEYRYRSDDYGDLEQTFFSSDLLPDLRNNDELNSLRLGFHHSFAPGSDLIGNFQYADLNNSLHDETPDPYLIYPTLILKPMTPPPGVNSPISLNRNFST
ncbi:MAG: FecR domain-containing protein [Desulforhopalus sp.]